MLGTTCWVVLNNGSPSQCAVKEEDTIDDFCKRDKITPFTVVFDGEQLSLYSLLMSQFKMTETKCLIITERIVYYRGVVQQYKQKYDDTVREFVTKGTL